MTAVEVRQPGEGVHAEGCSGTKWEGPVTDEGSVGGTEDKYAEIYADWRTEFLSGGLSDDEQRHCFNVGRVAIEFARIEEEIGHLLFELNENRRDTGTEYMGYVSASPRIAEFLRAAADEHPDLRVDLRSAADRYVEFGVKRNRYAHASVGSTAIVNAETGILEVKSMQEKHARSSSFRDLPTDDEIDDLCLAMRRMTLDLLETRRERSWARLVSAMGEAAP